MSTDIPECPTFLLNGGYNVHPVPTPVCTILLIINKKRAGIKNQNLMLFSRGKAISVDIAIFSLHLAGIRSLAGGINFGRTIYNCRPIGVDIFLVPVYP